MKKYILMTACLLMMLTVVAQQIPQDSTTHTLTKEEYLKKSKGQKTGAIVLLAAGGTLALIGAAVSVDEGVDYVFGEDSNGDVGGVLFVVGGVAMLGSIPLFVASRKNKEKAMKVSFKNELALQLQKGSMYYKSIPSVNIKISF